MFPRGLEQSGTWNAGGTDAAPWLAVELPEIERAAGIVICESFAAGAVCELRDTDRDEVLWQAKPERHRSLDWACALYVPLGQGPPRRVTIRLDASDGEPHQIDGVALVTQALPAIVASPREGQRRERRYRRYASSEVEAIDLRGDPRVEWTSAASSSSERPAAVGVWEGLRPPGVASDGGAWQPSGDGPDEWLEVSVPPGEPIYGVVVIDNGAVYRITDERGASLWLGEPEEVPKGEPRLLHVELTGSLGRHASASRSPHR